MNPERWQKLEEIFQATLQQTEQTREAFATEACCEDVELLEELRSLLKHYYEAGNLIESPAYIVAAESIINDGVSDKLEGRTFGPYHVRKILGKGGMGVVYLAFDERLQREIAIKFLHSDLLSDHRRVQRFKQEARAASALNHPNILTIHEIGEHNEAHYIATEFVAGETLRSKITDGPLSLIEALDIGIQVASALNAAHAAGVTHRDIKPENLMLRPDGLVKVLDFGLAKLADRATSPPRVNRGATTMRSITDPGIIMGTVKYMSPEQTQGSDVDQRSDIWSLGTVLYEMISGEPPFGGQTANHVTVAILDKKHKPLSDYYSNIPSELNWIVNKALRKDRDHRYQTVRDLLVDLQYLKQQIELSPERSEAVRADGDSTVARSQAANDGHSSGEPVSTSSAARKHSRRVINSLAVLPLANASNDPSVEYLSDGITESIINSLSQLPKLRVVPRSTVFRYKGQNVDPQQVGNDLGARAVLSGRLFQIGDRLIIKTELIDVLNESQLWGEQYNRKLSDILEIEAEISREISDKLRLKLTGEDKKRLAKRHTKSTEAYQAYLKGRYHWNKRTSEGLRRGITFFQEAIDHDPGYALAYAGLADSYLLLGAVEFGGLRPKETIAKVRLAAQRALELDEGLAEAHTSLGNIGFYTWDWNFAERAFKKALELNPNYATAHHWYANYLMADARFDEGLKEIRRAQELDPLSLPIILGEAWLFFLWRQYDKAIEGFRKVIELEPTFANSHLCLGMAYEQKQMHEQAIAQFQEAIKLSPESPLMRAALAHAYALSGKENEARTMLNEMVEQSARNYVSPYLIAAVCAGLGENEEAFKWLDRAYEEHSEGLFWFKVEPSMDNLRSDRRYGQLLQKAGFTV